MKNPDLIVVKKLKELNEDLTKRGFTLTFTEKGLEDLEDFYTDLYFEKRLMEENYFDQYIIPLTLLLGEIYIKTHGGKWYFVEMLGGTIDNIIVLEEPVIEGIICVNGKTSSSFVHELHEQLLTEEFHIISSVALMPAYSSIGMDCSRKY